MEEEQKIDFAKIEKKWQDKWEASKIFEAKEDSRKKYYILEMFPYPSAAGLHMGHAFNFTIGDVFARFKRMQGFNVLHPVGFDSLGLPAENAAIKAGKHPEDYTNNSIKNFIKQEKTLGLAYSWDRQVNTADSDYYKWDQWIFLKMFEKGLVYEKEAAINWCSKCNTIISNEQAQGGECDRCGTKIEIKRMNQWFLKITDYADRLLEGHKNLNWPEKTIAMQKNWIGKSYGTEIDFEIENHDKKPTVFLVHGWGGNNEGNWFNWIKEETQKSFDTIIPNFPNSTKPKLKEWIAEMEKYKSKFDSNTILIGHSLGCPTICSFLEKNKIKVKKLILVAPCPSKYNEKDFEIIKKLGAPKEEENALKRYLEDLNINFNNVSKYADKIVLYLSKDDPYVDNFNFRLNEYSALNYEAKLFENFGHFNGETGMGFFSEILNDIKNIWPIFTTRPDTIFGVTFMVVSAQHQNLMSLVTKEQKSAVDKFLEKVKSVSEKEMADMEKEGVFTGSYAINPATGDKVPVYAGNFVVADYGSGMVMAVPAHDQRDFEFAKKYNIPIKQVIEGKITEARAYTESGNLINSKEFDGISNEEAKKKISTWLETKEKARQVVNYKLRDWSVARQRYWGTPIPLIHCDKCGIVPVPEKDLPVKLPKEVKFGVGNPLLTNQEWLNVKCPKCGEDAKREVNTMDTFVNSSWYFLRYCDPKNNKEIFQKEKIKYWMPVDLYIGGAEHACMHLIYSRFYTMFLHDIGLLDFEESTPRLFHQGMINDSSGEKMSKSKGNVIEPLETMAKYGVDTTRFYLLSEASPDKGFNWSDGGIQGATRIINKVWRIGQNAKIGADSEQIKIKLNRTIKNLTEQIENLDYRRSTIELRELFDAISKESEISKDTFEKSLKLLAPFCPHIAEELWEKLGNKGFISLAEWPKHEEVKENKQKLDLNVNTVERVKEILDKLDQLITKVFVYVMPFEIKNINQEKIAKEVGKEVQIFSVSDSNKYDPENKSKKALPGKPGIYCE